MTKQVKIIRRYSLSFKYQVLRELEEEGISFEEIRRRYGIKGGATIQKWIRKFGRYHLINQVIRIETMEEKDRIKEMEKEIQKLKLALADSLLAQRCLEVVIDEANREYKTDLKKSFGESASPGSGNRTE
jgi:transposase-like protein